MSVKEQAIEDIKKELRDNGKSFLAFHKELDPVINSLVMSRIILQDNPHRYTAPSKANSQLVAKCLFCKDTGKTELMNYSRYYQDDKVQ